MRDEIEHLLANDDEITPSARFLPSVMETVEREAAAPRPLEFPWVRALPGLLATIAALAVAIWDGIGSLRDPATIALFDEQLRQLTVLGDNIGLQWIALAIAITIVSVTLPLKLTRVRIGL